MAAYTGLYVFDVYDAVQGGDNTLPALPLNLNGNVVVYGSDTYSTCDFGWFEGATDKVLRYALTRKNDGKTLKGLTKLSTYGSYGDSVGLAINGATPSSRDIGPGNIYREFATTDLTEIAIKFSSYLDPIAFWLPGATLDGPEPESRCILYKDTGFVFLDQNTTKSISVDTFEVSWRKPVTNYSGLWLDPIRPGTQRLKIPYFFYRQTPAIKTSTLFLLDRNIVIDNGKTRVWLSTQRG